MLLSVLTGLVLFALASVALWFVLRLDFVVAIDEAKPWALTLLMVVVGILGFSLHTLREMQSRNRAIETKKPASLISLLLAFIFVSAVSAFFGFIILTDVSGDLGFARPTFLLCIPILVAVSLYLWRLFLFDLYQRLNPQDTMRQPAVGGAEDVGIDDAAGDQDSSASKGE